MFKKHIFRFSLFFYRLYRQRSLRVISLCLVALITIKACSSPDAVTSNSLNNQLTQEDTLSIWWDKGFNPEEDEALRQLVRNWENQTGKKINLIFYTTDSLADKINRSLKAGNIPDIVMSFKAERSPNARLAWDNELVDLSDVIQPVENLYPKPILQTVKFYNNIQKKQSYYALPIHQGTMHIYYWRDLLQEVGRSDQDIPQEWDAFWQFWKQVQDDLQAKKSSSNQPPIYSLGLTLSPEAGDTYYLFEQILEAYDVEVISPQGQLKVDDVKVREGLIKVLKWYEDFYRQGYIPPTALKWLNPDNNRSILNREIVMTPNATLSIPAAVRQDPDIYKNKLGILEYPNKPNGEPMRHLTMAEQAAIMAQSKNQELAKDFLRYLVRTEVKKDYLTSAGGRNSPVLKPAWEDPFWSNPQDPHISFATKTFTEGRIRYFHISQNPAYSQVLDANIWGKALNRVIVDKIPAAQATDEAIAAIKQIYQKWEKS